MAATTSQDNTSKVREFMGGFVSGRRFVERAKNGASNFDVRTIVWMLRGPRAAVARGIPRSFHAQFTAINLIHEQIRPPV
jgi:hypothetical protein